jgi:hypothetical protein
VVQIKKTDQMLQNRRLQIKNALEAMIDAERHKEFQWLAVHHGHIGAEVTDGVRDTERDFPS